MKIQNKPFYGNIFIKKDAVNKNFIKESKNSKKSSKSQDPSSEILDKIEKLKKQLSNLQKKIALLSSNKDEASKELIALLNAQCGQINAQILSLFEQLLKGNLRV